ncbi:Proline iminopeptidase [Roseibium album]|nr:Proline iminopeptidase [Roseibium album]
MRIGQHLFDPGSGVLRTPDGDPVNLRPQTFAVLRHLADAQGGVVSKEDLLARVWPDVIVGEDSLYRCISELRGAIGDDRRLVLRTVPRRGYRLSVAGTVGPRVLPREPIRFTRSGDVQLAWTAVGGGTPVLKAPSWISNIESEADSLLFGPFYRRLGARARIVHFDQRGSSRSTRKIRDWSVDAMVSDMVAVADAADLERFFLFGPSQGGAFAIAFAARYPERVMGIVARGTFATGWKHLGDKAQQRRYEMSRTMISGGWGAENPEYRRFFTSLLVPDATPDIAREMDATQARAVTAEAQLANVELQSRLDIRDLLTRVTCPVLLLHSAGDLAIPVERAIELAAALPDCDLRILDGDNHIPVPGTAGYEQFMDAIDEFLDLHS